MLSVGVKAPDFSLPDSYGNIVSLSYFYGKKVVVYFYPKDNTSGCTKQACLFRDLHNEFNSLDVKVIGISKDSQKSHQKFIDNYQLPFTLLSDTELQAIKSYDVWQEKKLYGKTYMGVNRSTYVINEKGIITHVFEKAVPATNASDILSVLKA